MVESKNKQDRITSQHENVFRFTVRRCSIVIFAAILIPIGCSKEERHKLATSIQQQTQNIAEKTQQYTQAAVEKVEEQLPAEGSISLRMDPPLELDSASARVVSLGEGRGNVFQLSNYELGEGPRTYTSLLIQGPTEVETVASLTGKTIVCDFYLRTSNDDPVLMAGIGRPVEVNFGAFDVKSNTINATIYSGSLVSSDNRKVNLSGGKVIAQIDAGN